MAERMHLIDLAEEAVNGRGWDSDKDKKENLLLAGVVIAERPYSASVIYDDEGGLLKLECLYPLMNATPGMDILFASLVAEVNCALVFGYLNFDKKERIFSFRHSLFVKGVPNRELRLQIQSFLDAALDVYAMYSQAFIYLLEKMDYPDKRMMKLLTQPSEGAYLN